jgi:hypothetical protein
MAEHSKQKGISLYRRCADAAKQLMENPPEDYGGVFTEIDVVNEASLQSWSNRMFKQALAHANQVCGTLYRERKLCRYGPVELPTGHKDYGRIASKIVYAAADTGPAKWDTPNGKFPKLMIENDQLKAQGRKYGTNRNDLEPWENQEIKKTGEEKDAAHDRKRGTPVAEGPLLKRISELEKKLKERDEKLAEREERIKALTGNKDEVLGLVDALRVHVEELENAKA